VTHAGFNTVLEALTQGVPQLAIPITNDQPGVAARIADKRTGVVTSFDQLNASHLSTLLGEVLKNPAYRAKAGKLQQAIAETNGLSLAADLLEKALGLTKTVAKSGAPSASLRVSRIPLVRS
jgi:zeaxanthin glucosyltransferase